MVLERRRRPGHGRLGPNGALLVVLLLAGGVPVTAQSGPGTDGAEAASRCADGVVTSIDLQRHIAFDPDSTGIGVLAWTYRAMDVLHVRTQPSFIRRELLFDVGDCYDAFLVSESERLLDGYGFLGSARIRSEGDGRGGRAVLVETVDEWSTQVDVGVTYDDGVNLEKLEVTEENFLGQGIFAEFTHQARREIRAQSFRLSTPRLFGRTDASIGLGRDRPGSFFSQHLRYPFVGETGRWSLRQGFDRGTSFYAYALPAAGQILVPAFSEVFELSVANRFGELGRSLIAGLTLTREVDRFGEPQMAANGSLDELTAIPGGVPPEIAVQLREGAATRVWLHLGARRFRYEERVGLDGLRDRLLVGFGYFGGISLGRAFDVWAPADVPGSSDLFGRANGTFTLPVGSSIVHGGSRMEVRETPAGWRDLLAEGELVAYLRNDDLPGNTVFLRASAAGGWRTTIPFQLALGGREGVRSLSEDRFPGGRMARFVVEDRVVFPWPKRSMDLGMTLFADVGRVWPGDAPYGGDSGWQAAMGVGLRVGLPARSRHIWRADVAFPVGRTGGSPIFRVTFELNRMARGFFVPDMVRSRRLALGAQHF